MHKFSKSPANAKVCTVCGTGPFSKEHVTRKSRVVSASPAEVAAGSDTTQEKVAGEAENALPASTPVVTSSSSPVNPVSGEPKMQLVFTKSKLNKKGTKAVYTNPAIRFGLTVSKTLFATFPETITMDAEGFNTVGADEQAKIAKRNADRAAKGLKPLATPEEKLAALKARIEKSDARSARAKAQADKLAAKLGTPAAPAAPGMTTTPA